MSLRTRLGRGWAEDPLWGSVYDWSTRHDRAGGLLWRIGFGADLARLHDAASAVVGLGAGARVLDIPCGGGVALSGVRRGQGLDYVAADLSPVMLERTRRAAERRGVADQVRLLEADVTALPLPDAGTDLVLTLTSLHCFPDPRAAVAEMARVLAPGGRIVGSAVLADSGLRYLPLATGGRAAGLIGPGVTGTQIGDWLSEEGLRKVTLRRSGMIGYFTAVRG